MATDALSRSHSLLVVMEARVLGFHSSKFSTTKMRILAPLSIIERVGSEALILSKSASYSRGVSYVFPRVPFRNLVKDVHGGGLTSHLGIN